ncbi:hypothetical protein CC86DRAFT_452951 [Ophiobolus disseminans]|uniref:Uncharacterized protein n=1 Tax=Ophiobolus disseminans TaxID=1469910 RepID=A0A6A7AD77_9PLEO|nr:hypothetical protein CC86DRAFT_452951 [Ophiobolus disseminans]
MSTSEAPGKEFGPAGGGQAAWPALQRRRMGCCPGGCSLAHDGVPRTGKEDLVGYGLYAAESDWRRIRGRRVRSHAQASKDSSCIVWKMSARRHSHSHFAAPMTAPNQPDSSRTREERTKFASSHPGAHANLQQNQSGSPSNVVSGSRSRAKQGFSLIIVSALPFKGFRFPSTHNERRLKFYEGVRCSARTNLQLALGSRAMSCNRQEHRCPARGAATVPHEGQHT